MNSKSMMRNNLEDTRGYKNKYPKQEDWQKKWWFIVKTVQSKGKNITDPLFQSRAYNPITRSYDTKSNLKDFVKNNKNPWNSYESAIKEWYDATFRDVVNPEWTSYNVWEWEVLYPKKNSWTDSRNYLEDIVEIVEESNAEWKTSKWLENNYWSLEQQLRALWLSESEIAATEQVLQIVQEPLPWMWWEIRQVAENEWWILKKAQKNTKSNSKSK